VRVVVCIVGGIFEDSMPRRAGDRLR
jgi:hypothetical protein